MNEVLSSETLFDQRSINSTPHFNVRPFGLQKEDLNIDFRDSDRVLLVTEILHCCLSGKTGEKVSRSLLLNLSISWRSEMLLHIVWLNLPGNLPVHLTCSDLSCLQEIEVEFSREDLFQLNQSNNLPDHTFIDLNGTNLKIRKPTGRDQLKWLEQKYPDEATAIRYLVRSLIEEDNIENTLEINLMEEQELIKINEALENLDPTLNFNIQVNCPYCNSIDNYPMDLEKLALRELERVQKNLIKEIHQLASFYHWSEDQIFSIPPLRRTQYLYLIKVDTQ